jgi:hypothetical protein
LVTVRSIFRSYHAIKAVEFAPRTDDRRYHSFLAKANEEKLLDAKVFARRLRIRGILGGLFLPLVFISYIHTYVVNKNKKLGVCYSYLNRNKCVVYVKQDCVDLELDLGLDLDLGLHT